MTYIVYGIKNCDTIKKTLTWLKKENIPFEFYDYKTQCISSDKLEEWCRQKGWENLVNKKGTTWRQLDEDVKNKVKDATSAILLMKDKPSLIKRPLIEHKGKVVVLGFDEGLYQKLFL